ncbi:MAG TPA: protease pro-enzyme activation domain-containing protein, partial [Bryobacteraceae bacterium]|nr:protease pro-enzyme activation domain-containing protein [Bryobacteraceae bacterium]
MARLDRMTVAIGLPLRNQDELNTFLKQVVDPASPNFRQYLTPAQFTERYGPTEADYQALTSFMEANGLSVTGKHTNRMILDVGGTVAAIESALHVNMIYWRHPTRGEFFAPDREPSLDTSVAILNISGLNNFMLPRPMDLKSRSLSTAKPLTTGSGPSGLFNGTDYRNAYAPSVTLNGAGQSVGLLELDGFYAGDVTANFKEAGLPQVPVKTVLLDGFNGVPGQNNVEVILDIMMASYMSPGLTNVIVYEGTNPDDVLNRMATDNLASQLSSSWGWSPLDATALQAFTEMVAQGQSMFQASGDSGAYTGGIMPPADVPNLTTVGGTSLTTAGAGGAWQSEATWSGSGGGVSTTYPIPSYQQTVNTTAARGSATMRNIPDVALLADIQIFLICNNGQWISVGGTSAATPLWAGFLALANQQAAANAQPRIGFANPPLYAIGAGSSYQSDLHDITTGNDGGFNALPGYDLATGWGSPAGQPLINSLTGKSSGPSFGLSSSASTLAIAAGASGTSTITINAQNSFSSAVSLAASGLPTGVTASFNPATATTTSTLTLTVSSSAASSTSTITITGTSASLTSTARLSLTVTGLPAFTMAASPASVSVAQGASATSTVTITPQNGFTGTVALAATGLPTGVTASFGAVTSGKSTLTLTAASTAAAGTSTLTITGTSGSLTTTTPVNLTITGAPTFAISASPSSLTVFQGSTGASTITVTPQNTFNGTVTLAASGLPSGVTASFSTATTTKPGTLTLTASASAAIGTSIVTITGTSGSLHSTTGVSVSVATPPSFALTASPASLSVLPAASGASTITVVPQNGFSGSVALATSGLPSGVTATFSPLGSLSTTLTLSATANATTGPATVTITGTSGSLSSKATIALTIVAQPIFTLAATPAALSIAPGASGTSSIAITA